MAYAIIAMVLMCLAQMQHNNSISDLHILLETLGITFLSSLVAMIGNRECDIKLWLKGGRESYTSLLLHVTRFLIA